MDDLKELDLLHIKLNDSATIKEAKDILIKHNINPQYANIFLSAHLFAYFPDFYNSESCQINEVALTLLTNTSEFNNTFFKFKELLNTFKNENKESLSNDITDMIQKTNESLSSTSDEQVQRCLKTQNEILNEAINYFEKKNIKRDNA